MDIISVAKALKDGKAVKRSDWGDTAIHAVQLGADDYRIFATGTPNSEVLALLSGDFEEVKTE